ncbi:MAG: hypothetical protein Kow0029_13540 [Candidatus Rifleibacteriota bacterium]
MKKFLSFTFAIMFLISAAGLVGCNGLWDFDDDDDATVAPINFSIPAQIQLANVENSMLAAVVAGGAADYSKLKASVYAKSTDAKTADTLMTTTPIDVAADGSFTAAFQGYAGSSYYVKVVNPNVAGFVLYIYWENLTSNVTTTQNITEETTAAGLAIQAAKKAGRIASVSDISAATLATLKGKVTTALTTPGSDLNSFVDDPAFIAATVVAVTGVTLNKSTTSIVVGGTETLVATVAPTNATDKTVTWSSDNTAVATVDANGKVTGVSAGTATITVTTTDGGKTATCVVTVTASTTTVSVTGVTLNKSTTSIAVGATETLVATVAPTNATNKTVTWSTSDATIATVSNAGVVTGVKAGTATITVTTADGGKTATCVVTVTASAAGNTVTLNNTVTTGTTTSMQIKLTGMSATDEATLDNNSTLKVTLSAGGTNYDLTVNKTISGLVDGTVLTTTTTTLATFDSFNSITFSEALPTGTVVIVTQSGTEVARSQ